MRRLLVLLSFFALSFGAAFAQDARHLRNDPSYIWAEDAPGLSALDGLVAKLPAVDSGVPAGMWPSYKAAVRSISKFMVLEDGRQLRYMLRSDVQTLVKDRRRKVSELLHHASAESSAGRARTYLGWAEAYLESLPQDPALRAEAARLRKRFGDGPGERVRMRNIESEVALIRRVLPSPGQVEPAVQHVSPLRNRTEGSGEQSYSLSQASPSPARPICDTLRLPAAGLPLPSFASVGSHLFGIWCHGFPMTALLPQGCLPDCERAGSGRMFQATPVLGGRMRNTFAAARATLLLAVSGLPANRLPHACLSAEASFLAWAIM